MSKLTSADYLRIKWPIMALVASIVIAFSVYGSLRQLDLSADSALNLARAQLDDAQARVDLIAEEESTIREHMGHYQEISAAGVVAGEDRLQLLERVADLREKHSLFPIDIKIDEQDRLPLQYGELGGKVVNDPGRPISLMTSTVEIRLPLLHENDLNNLLSGLLDGDELLQMHSCNLSASLGSTDYLRLGQHFNASCLLTWYTFAISGPAPVGDVQ